MALIRAPTPLRAGPVRPPPARPPAPLRTAFGEERNKKTREERATSKSTAASGFRPFTFVGLGYLRHFVQREQRRDGTAAAPALPFRGWGGRGERKSSAQAQLRAAPRLAEY